MKIVVIGGSGLIGSNVVDRLRRDGHEVVAASPRTGVNTLTGAGLGTALAGARVVVDVANSPSFEDDAVLAFFETSGRNLLAAARQAGVAHHVALSVVGLERLPHSGYFRAKVAQERLIQAGNMPYTILRSTQFFEFLPGIVGASAGEGGLSLSPALVQPIAADDVAAALAGLAVRAPLNGMVEVAGPDRFPLDELTRRFLASQGDPRQVIADIHARYFGSELNDQSLVPSPGARIGPTRFQNWLARQAAPNGRPGTHSHPSQENPS